MSSTAKRSVLLISNNCDSMKTHPNNPILIWQNTQELFITVFLCCDLQLKLLAPLDFCSKEHFHFSPWHCKSMWGILNETHYAEVNHGPVLFSVTSEALSFVRQLNSQRQVGSFVEILLWSHVTLPCKVIYTPLGANLEKNVKLDQFSTHIKPKLRADLKLWSLSFPLDCRLWLSPSH